MKGFLKFIVVTVFFIGFKPLTAFSDTNRVVGNVDQVLPESENSVGIVISNNFLSVVADYQPYIKVTSYEPVTNGVGGFNYYMYVESYTTNKTRTIVGQVTTNLVTGPWFTADTTKIRYEPLYRYKVGPTYYDRFLCIYTETNLCFRPVMY